MPPGPGKVAEWSNAPDSKSGVPVSGTVGSNPTLPARIATKTGLSGPVFFFVWTTAAAPCPTAPGECVYPDQSEAGTDPMIEFGHLTHVGLRRQLNEDTYYGDGELGLWLVADGMGGHACGEVASALARETIVREIRSGTPLAQAIRIADEEIIRVSRRRNDALPMGTTVVAARVQGQRYEVAWVGDSRAYLWQDGTLAQLSQDHSYVQTLVDEGTLTPEQARSHPHRNVVTQALGVTDPNHLNVSMTAGELRPGMQLLLCSDGLTEEVEDARIADTLGGLDCSAQECVDTLVAAALDGGGSDNVTAVLVRCQ